MQERESTLGTNQQWFISAGGGGYSFSPRSARYEVSGVDRFYVCLGVSGTSSAQTVGMLTSGNNLTVERLWVILPIQAMNTVRVQVYFDQSYVDRYGGTSTDPNTRKSVAMYRIYEQMAQLRKKYYEEFSIIIKTTVMNSVYEDCPMCVAECTAKDSLGLCACSTNCNAHHTNISTLNTHLKETFGWRTQENPDYIIRVFFIGHDYCRTGDDHGKMYSAGMCSPINGVILVHHRYNYQTLNGQELQTNATQADEKNIDT